MAGIGVIPVASAMALIRWDWWNLGGLIGTLSVVLMLRVLGLRLYLGRPTEPRS